MLLWESICSAQHDERRRVQCFDPSERHSVRPVLSCLVVFFFLVSETEWCETIVMKDILCRCAYSHKFWFNLFSRSVSEIKYTCTTETFCHRNFSLNRNSCIFVFKVDILCRCAYSQEIPNGEHDTMTKTYNWITTCVKLVSQIHIIYMSEKLFGYNLQWTLQLVVDYVYLIITDIRIWFSVRLPITNACQ